MEQTQLRFAVALFVLTTLPLHVSASCVPARRLAPLRQALEAFGVGDALQCTQTLPTLLFGSPVREDGGDRSKQSGCVLPSFEKIARTGTDALRCLQNTCQQSEAQPAAAGSSTGFSNDTALEAVHLCSLLSANGDVLLENLTSTRELCCSFGGSRTVSDCLSSLKPIEELSKMLQQQPRAGLGSDTHAPPGAQLPQRFLTCFQGLEEIISVFSSPLTAQESNLTANDAEYGLLLADLRESTTKLTNLVDELSLSQQGGPQGSHGVAQASTLLVCTALFPCKNESRLLPCWDTCRYVTNLLASLKPFTRIDSIAVLRMLKETAGSVCSPTPESDSGLCVRASCKTSDCSTFRLSVQPADVQLSLASTQRPGGLCLRFQCPYPLRATTTSAHWDRSISGNLRNLHAALAKAFPNASRPFDESVLPCGQDCVSVGFTKSEEKVAKILLSLGAFGVELFAIIAALAFYFNRASLGSVLVRRLVFYFNLSAALTVSVFLPVAFSNVKNIVCHDDGTRRIDEPNTSGWCVLTETLAHFGINMNGLLFISFTHAWYELIKSLHSPGATARGRKTSGHSLPGQGLRRENVYFMDAVYLGGSLFVSLIIVLTVLGQRGIEGSPLYGICMTKINGFFIEAVITPLCVFCFFGLCFLGAGLYELAKHRRAERQRQKRLESEAAETGVPNPSASLPRKPRKTSTVSNSKTSSAFRRLIWQLFLYIIVLLVNIIGLIILGAYVGANRDDWKTKTKDHLTCVLSSCEPAQCPPLPRIQVGFFLTPFLLGFVSYMILCSWACSWSLWQHLRFCKWILEYVPSSTREVRPVAEEPDERRKCAGSENSSSSGSGSGSGGSASTNTTLKTNASTLTTCV